MPVLHTKIEGRGNGIKTVIPNMEDVARALNRPPTCKPYLGHKTGMLIPSAADPTKFFGCELGAQTTFANDRYIVNGAHQSDRLRELLDAFIDKFVLCASCKNPETELVITGKGNNELIHRDCKACGAQTNLQMSHKLVTFILKNPPKKKEKGKKGKKSGGMTAEANVGGPIVFDAEKNGNGNADGSGDEPDSPGLADQAGVPTSGTDIDAVLGKMDPVIENPDAAEDVARKLQALDVTSPGGGGIGGDDDDEDDAADSPYAVLGEWLVENRGADDAEITGKIKEIGIMGKHKVLLEIGEKLFTDGIVWELAKRTTLIQVVSSSSSPQQDDFRFHRQKLLHFTVCHALVPRTPKLHHPFCPEPTESLITQTSLFPSGFPQATSNELTIAQLTTSEKHQKSLLGGIERLLANSPNSDTLLSSGTTAKVLMTLYQADILDEALVRHWSTHVSKKYVDKEKSKRVRKSADAFIKVRRLSPDPITFRRFGRTLYGLTGF